MGSFSNKPSVALRRNFISTTNTKIVQMPIQFPGEARPLTRDERQFYREKATHLRQHLETLTAQGNTLKMQISTSTEQPKKFE